MMRVDLLGEQYFDHKRLAQYLSVKPRTVRKWRQDKKIIPDMIAGRQYGKWIYADDDIIEWLERSVRNGVINFHRGIVRDCLLTYKRASREFNLSVSFFRDHVLDKTLPHISITEGKVVRMESESIKKFLGEQSKSIHRKSKYSAQALMRAWLRDRYGS